METQKSYTTEDVGNIVLLEHLNVQVSDQSQAILFYIVGLGLTRDPYLTVGLGNMWVNVGEQQFHLPTRGAQRFAGHVGLVIPDPEHLEQRLESIKESLAGTKFKWSRENGYIAATCPWGNNFRCYMPEEKFGDMALGIPYIELLVKPGAAEGIACFYREVFRAPAAIEKDGGVATARVAIGRNQELIFRETSESIPPYDGHHVAIYVANFSCPYEFLNRRGLVTEDVRGHQFRFQKIVEPETGATLHELEHEVRSLRHPLYQRGFVNRNAEQTQRNYKRGRDGRIPFGS
ncbi:MAG TPA: hypothetical protein VL754_05900 [Verrucomicrobiae bacterium]|jgi:hypothetical protein|nr:hypothetical protein [Verrucomicrobiae bacterium]